MVETSQIVGAAMCVNSKVELLSLPLIALMALKPDSCSFQRPIKMSAVVFLQRSPLIRRTIVATLMLKMARRPPKTGLSFPFLSKKGHSGILPQR